MFRMKKLSVILRKDCWKQTSYISIVLKEKHTLLEVFKLIRMS